MQLLADKCVELNIVAKSSDDTVRKFDQYSVALMNFNLASKNVGCFRPITTATSSPQWKTYSTFTNDRMIR